MTGNGVLRSESTTCNTTASRCEHDVTSTDTTVFKAVTNNFTNAGGDGYTMLVETTPSAGLDVLMDVFLGYLKSKPTITPVVAGRIKRL